MKDITIKAKTLTIFNSNDFSVIGFESVDDLLEQIFESEHQEYVKDWFLKNFRDQGVTYDNSEDQTSYL